MDPLFLFLLGHFVGDYALQTDRIAKNKNGLNGHLFLHVSVYTLIIAMFSWFHDIFYDPNILSAVLPWLIPIFLIHLAQDYIKSRFFRESRQFYYIDQALHISALYVLRIIVGG